MTARLCDRDERHAASGGSDYSGILLQWGFPGRSLWEFCREPVMFKMVERFHGQV